MTQDLFLRLAVFDDDGNFQKQKAAFIGDACAPVRQGRKDDGRLLGSFLVLQVRLRTYMSGFLGFARLCQALPEPIASTFLLLSRKRRRKKEKKTKKERKTKGEREIPVLFVHQYFVCAFRLASLDSLVDIGR